MEQPQADPVVAMIFEKLESGFGNAIVFEDAAYLFRLGEKRQIGADCKLFCPRIYRTPNPRQQNCKNPRLQIVTRWRIAMQQTSAPYLQGFASAAQAGSTEFVALE